MNSGMELPENFHWAENFRKITNYHFKKFSAATYFDRGDDSIASFRAISSTWPKRFLKKSFSEKIYDFDRKIVFSRFAHALFSMFTLWMDPVNRGLSFGRFFLIKYSAAPSED